MTSAFQLEPLVLSDLVPVQLGNSGGGGWDITPMPPPNVLAGRRKLDPSSESDTLSTLEPESANLDTLLDPSLAVQA